MLVAAEGRKAVSTSVVTVQIHALFVAVTVLQEETMGNGVNTRLRLRCTETDGRCSFPASIQHIRLWKTLTPICALLSGGMQLAMRREKGFSFSKSQVG